ncbi:MAG: hypothetical protein ABW047_09995 [Nitrospiraceae bacterium]
MALFAPVSVSGVSWVQLADAIHLTNEAIVELTDAPGLGKRMTVDFVKRSGADLGVIDSAAAKLQDALSKAQSGRRAKIRCIGDGPASCERSLRASAYRNLRRGAPSPEIFIVSPIKDADFS